ncbi:MAG: aminotransferase class V-fold PLP-dependent enzyme [Acidobacteria bacterium]|nr:aminotransferase class V-fold PLP-dependent enzyme [Acidobacteriota bacterium]
MAPRRTSASTAERVALDEFLTLHPEYAATSVLDELRVSDYGRLDAGGHVYLDYTGGGLYAERQIREHADLLTRGVFGNPHSASLTSLQTTDLVEEARRAILRWFNADGYTAVFTQNATAAIKLVGESYAFSSGGRLLLTADNHNSVNGIREFAAAKGASISYVPLTTPDLRIDRQELETSIGAVDPSRNNLFAFPAQSNFSGVQHPLELVEEAHDRRWHVLLDAAAFVPSNHLDLQRVRPEFVSVSFYKMFGYPTGVGCLLARNDALKTLRRPWFAGGTVNFATVRGRHRLLSPGEAGFEDGTLNYLAIPAVAIGLRYLASVGVDVVQTRTKCLTDWLLQQLLDLRHSNGRPMVRLYGPATTVARGATITMNFYDAEGRLLDYRRVEELASQQGISVRTGCFCNPGPGETAEGLTEEDIAAAIAENSDMTLPRFLQFITHRGGKSAGAIRVSLGLATNFADVFRFMQFARGLRDQTRIAIGETAFDIESCRVIRDGS